MPTLEIQAVSNRICDRCGEPMAHLGDIPRVPPRSGISVFRCYQCNNVASDEWEMN